MRVLLTGSSGWLGQFLAPRLRAAGHVAIGLDVVPGADTQVVGSVADRATVEHTLSNHGIEAVVHAGALHKPDIARYPASAFIDANVTGTLNLLEAAVRSGPRPFRLYLDDVADDFAGHQSGGGLCCGLGRRDLGAARAPEHLWGD